MFIIYADGSCLGNPGPGGYCAIIITPDAGEQRIVGSVPHTTNNRMELTAAIKGLEEIPLHAEVEIRSDSEYVVKGMNEWIERWKERAWKNSKNQPVENQDLWRQLNMLALRRDVRWTWIKGHAGDPMNELADRLAREAAEKKAAKLAGVVAG